MPGLHITHRPKDFDEIIGNKSIVASLKSILEREDRPHVFLFSGESGCVDSDTEFFCQRGWKKISSYEYGKDKVLQYNKKNKTANFVHPIQYIKQKAEYLYFFKTKYGVNQCLSLEHNVLYQNKKNNKLYDIQFSKLRENHIKNKQGFKGCFLTTFNIDVNFSGMNLSNEELLVQIMFNADGTISNNRKKGCVNLKKQRKVERAEFLLKKANIEFDKYIMNNNCVRFCFIPPLREKKYINKYYNCTKKQLKIIISEIMFWDGDFKKGRIFTSKNKMDVDFIQYAYAVNNIRSTISIDNRTNKPYYRLIVSKNNLVGMGGNRKTQIQKIKTIDGYEYCFTVPSSYLILRRKDKIFITGNCGKTTLARIVADKLGCSKIDLLEYNSANTRGIPTARDIVSDMWYKPLSGEVKIYLMDECHQWTKDFQEAILKPLEDTPSHVYFLLCTTMPDKLLKAIKNRCAQFSVQKLQSNRIVRLLNKICKKEEIEIPDDITKEIAMASEGSPRQALIILDQIRDLKSDDMTEAIRDTKVEQKQIIELCRALLENKNWSVISKILKGIEDEPEKVRRAVLGYMTSVLLSKDNFQAGMIIECFEDNFYDGGRSSLVLACYHAIKN